MMQKPLFIATSILISVNMLCSALSSAFPSGFWALIACASFIIFCAVMLRFVPASFLLLSPLLFLRATEMLSGVAIEYGARIDELMVQGYATGAFTRLGAMYMLLFSVSSVITERAWVKSREHMLTLPERLSRVPGFWLFMFLAMAGLVYLVSLGRQMGFPLIEGVDRFRFRVDMDSRMYISIMDNRFILVTVLGFFALDPARRHVALLGIFAVFAISILYAEKFTSLSLMMILILVPRGLVYLAHKERLPVALLVKFPIGIAALTVPVILLVYGFGENPTLAVQKLANRMAAQGELWWVADRDHMELFRLEGDTIIADIKTWFNPAAQNPIEVGTRFGLYYAMQPYAPGEIAYAAGHQGTGYVFSLFLYLMMTTGVLGTLLIGLAAHLLFAMAMSWMLRAIADADWLRLIVTMKLVNFYLSGGFIVGYLWFFFGIKSLIVIAMILVLQVVRIPIISAGRPKRVANA